MKKLFLVLMLLMFCATANAATIRKVDILFGGDYECSESELGAVKDTYNAWATTYGLLKRGYKILNTNNPDGSKTFRGVRFKYAKIGLLESDLQVFNETWYNLTIPLLIERHTTDIMYYTVEE